LWRDWRAWEANAAILVDILQLLHGSRRRVSALLLNHPRKKPSEAGHSARGHKAAATHAES
jgi:hypothetical protein